MASATGAINLAHLHPDHLADLRKSGLSDEMIDRCGFYTNHRPAEVQRILRWRFPAASLGLCMVIPFFDIGGKRTGFARVRPSSPTYETRADGSLRPRKYEQPVGLSPRPYFPPGVGALLADPSANLLLTEGEKKAAKAVQEGFACVGLTGVECWSAPRRDDGPRTLHPDILALGLAGRKAYIVFDSDAATVPEVRWAEQSLARALLAAGAVPHVVRLPGGGVA